MQNIKYTYNDNIGPETKFNEYKIFNFFPGGLPITHEDAILLIKNKKWIFNNYVIKNLKLLIKIYFPKYCCAFLSNNMEEDSNLYFGISDDGTIVGIPYEGILDENLIIDNCKKIILTHIKDVNKIDNGAGYFLL